MKNYVQFINEIVDYTKIDPYGEEIWEDVINSLRIVYKKIENFDIIEDIEIIDYVDNGEEIPEINFKIKNDTDYNFKIYKEFDSRGEEPVIIEVIYKNLLRSSRTRLVDDFSEENLYHEILELYNILKNKKYK